MCQASIRQKSLEDWALAHGRAEGREEKAIFTRALIRKLLGRSDPAALWFWTCFARPSLIFWSCTVSGLRQSSEIIKQVALVKWWAHSRFVRIRPEIESADGFHSPPPLFLRSNERELARFVWVRVSASRYFARLNFHQQSLLKYIR